ncbi:MAG: hypothetical protein NW226_01770 [Microscillaceae bacterium]|nr:hypothetical protein [Microscillaceae bacterium]
MMGYYLIFTLKYYQIKKAFSLKIAHENIPQNRYIVVKIPLNLPYPIDWPDYEKVSGSFSYQGKYYEKVKQILRRDTMIVYCLENKAQKKLIHELSDYTKSFLFDLDKKLPQNNKKHTFIFIKEYVLPSKTFIHPIIHRVLQAYSTEYLLKEYSHFLNIPVPPPESLQYA